MSIAGISNVSSTPSPSSTASSPSATAAAATVSVAIPGSPFVQQVRTTPDSLVVKPQMPPLLFDPDAEPILSPAIGSLVDETA